MFLKYICTKNLRRFSTNVYQNADYQYMQQSEIPTMHFQNSLPRLPIPPLKKTCERYLAAQCPLLDDKAFKHVTSQVSIFSNGVGIKLNELLVNTDNNNKHTSYISKIWFDMYLSDRIPLPINYNPLLLFTNDARPEYNNQLIKAANVLISSVRFMLSLRRNILEPEVLHLNPKKSNTEMFRRITRFLPSAISWYGAHALDMSQFLGLFGSSRIPEIDKDRILTESNSKHILVQRNGYFYTFDVLDDEGYLIEPTKILSRLKYIISDERAPAEYPLGILTTQKRDVWASQRQYLCQLGNEKTLRTLDTALFNLILDDIEIKDNMKTSVATFLHGDGTNRWFDKSFSYIIAKDGSSAINFEHSWGDGVALLRYLQDVYKEMTTKPFVTPEMLCNESNSDSFVTKLEFNFDDKLKDDIKNAKQAYKKFYQSLAKNYLMYEDIGRLSCRKHKVSPDAIMQLGFQAAYHSMTGQYVGTYESCSTAAFKHGRTETVRPCTVHTKAFCDALHSSSRPSDSEMAKVLVMCSNAHSQLVKEAVSGQGFDRHLLALKKLAEKEGLLPEIFSDDKYKMISSSILSTSTLSSPALIVVGFGPVRIDGLGIGYTISDDKFKVTVTNYPPHNDGKQFIQALEIAFKDINKIMQCIKN